MKVIFLPSAKAEIEKIGDYIAIESARKAVSFIAELRQRGESLRDIPERFPLMPRYETRGVRRLVHGNYLIFYAIRAETVFILHVLHGRMDYERILFPDS